MKLPKKVRVLAMDYDISLKNEIVINGESGYMGSCSYSNSEIEILGSCSKSKIIETFLHELTHAILFECGYELEEHDEKKVDRFSKVLHQVLMDNDFSFLKK